VSFLKLCDHMCTARALCANLIVVTGWSLLPTNDNGCGSLTVGELNLICLGDQFLVAVCRGAQSTMWPVTSMLPWPKERSDGGKGERHSRRVHSVSYRLTAGGGLGQTAPGPWPRVEHPS